MQKLNKITVLFITSMLLVSAPAFPGNLTADFGQPEVTAQVAKGAASPTELARVVLQAIQENNFQNLSPFLLDDEGLAWLKKNGSENIRGLFQNSSAADIKNNLKTDYEDIIKQGISYTINWSEMALAETLLGKGSVKSPMVQPVTLTLTNKAKQPVQLILETVKLNNRYYLLQRMQLKAQSKNTITG